MASMPYQLLARRWPAWTAQRSSSRGRCSAGRYRCQHRLLPGCPRECYHQQGEPPGLLALSSRGHTSRGIASWRHGIHAWGTAMFHPCSHPDLWLLLSVSPHLCAPLEWPQVAAACARKEHAIRRHPTTSDALPDTSQRVDSYFSTTAPSGSHARASLTKYYCPLPTPAVRFALVSR